MTEEERLAKLENEFLLLHTEHQELRADFKMLEKDIRGNGMPGVIDILKEVKSLLLKQEDNFQNYLKQERQATCFYLEARGEGNARTEIQALVKQTKATMVGTMITGGSLVLAIIVAILTLA